MVSIETIVSTVPGCATDAFKFKRSGAEGFYGGVPTVTSMGCEGCHAWGDIDTAFLREQADAVMDRLEGEEDIRFSIVAIDSPDRCREAAETIDADDVEAFIEDCRTAQTSVSLTSGGQEFIILRPGRDFLAEDPAALRGLIAHELIHTVQRRNGVEEAVEQAAKDYQDAMVDRLAASGLDRDEIMRFIYTVFQTAIYALKDIEANTALIRQGFADDLTAYYRQMIGIDEFCPAPDFHGEDASLESVEDAITFELGLLPAWLPFVVHEPDDASIIRDRLEECYEPHIPDVADYIAALQDLYADIYRDDPAAFRHRFFIQVVERSLDLITRKVDRPDIDAT